MSRSSGRLRRGYYGAKRETRGARPNMDLSAEEVRVLGCLIEKQATTPDHYPLSTNALTNACNQKSSREPVVAYPDRLVAETMLLLRPAGLARTVTSGRTEKHRHVLDEAFGLQPKELAVLAVMMLRGPQSAGELRTRTERYVDFQSLEEIESVLSALASRDEPLVVNIGRGSGQSQDRWRHLLGGEQITAPEHQDPMGRPMGRGEASMSVASGASLADQVADLQARLTRIEQELGL